MSYEQIKISHNGIGIHTIDSDWDRAATCAYWDATPLVSWPEVLALGVSMHFKSVGTQCRPAYNGYAA